MCPLTAQFDVNTVVPHFCNEKRDLIIRGVDSFEQGST